jgi:hypothetical protein
MVRRSKRGGRKMTERKAVVRAQELRPGDVIRRNEVEWCVEGVVFGGKFVEDEVYVTMVGGDEYGTCVGVLFEPNEVVDVCRFAEEGYAWS